MFISQKYKQHCGTKDDSLNYFYFEKCFQILILIRVLSSIHLLKNVILKPVFDFLHFYINEIVYFTTFSFLVIVGFPLIETPDVSMLAWTTTPWTLPSNLALVVHPDLQYVKVKGMISRR